MKEKQDRILERKTGARRQKAELSICAGRRLGLEICPASD